MTLIFYIHYNAPEGAFLCVSGSVPELGQDNFQNAIPMNFMGDGVWSLAIDLPCQNFTYSYFVRNADGTERHEWGKPRLFCHEGEGDCLIYDYWQDLPKNKAYYSSAFTECICRRKISEGPIASERGKLVIHASAPMINENQALAILGNSEVLGNWDVEKAIVMNDSLFPTWTAKVPITEDLNEETEYKFLVVEKDTGKVISWEKGDNRKLGFNPTSENACILSGMHFHDAQRPWHGAGTAIPVFSLRSEEDFGVGEFLDLIPLIDWAASTGQSFIQILPINDTTMAHNWSDSYPYNANSTFALHPQYLRLSKIGTLVDGERQNYYSSLAAELNALPELDYERVNNAKNAYTRELFRQEGAEAVASPEFKKFVEKNREWLLPYAAYCVLRDRYQTADFRHWEEFSVFNTEKIEEFAKRNTSYFDYVFFLQYHLDKQLKEVRDYAHAKGVAIKGDIPIGISNCSADAWIHPELFFLHSQAGAPPDDFAVLGQNWGFPTYNWEIMKLDGYAWWKARFRKMSEYFDAYRIDHVLGFFRIWEIPVDSYHGLLGHFNPALPLSPEEMNQDFDFNFKEDLMTKPFISDESLSTVFGDLADEARHSYLLPDEEGRYSIKPDFNTQRKVALHFEAKGDDEKNQRLCEGLMTLLDDVLFVEDPEKRGKYHPRISAWTTFIYKSLSSYERWCFDRLYHNFYYERHNVFWRESAMQKLPPLIDSTDMLVCAEDLGMIPACVPEVLDKLRILSLEIQRMPKEANSNFGDTWNYPYLSVCTTSTHDMSGIRGWWEEDPALTQEYYTNVLRLEGKAPRVIEGWICEKIINLNLKSPSMLCILPLQDWLSIDGDLRRDNPQDERINVPANSRHYWRYRMHITLERLLSEKSFNSHIKQLIKSSAR